MTFSIQNLITHAVNEKPSDFAQEFQGLVLDKLQTAVANKKIELAAGLVGGTPEQAEEPEIENTEEGETDA